MLLFDECYENVYTYINILNRIVKLFEAPVLPEKVTLNRNYRR
jgi:hypothetical protein